jgi:hypothetical protein
MESTITLYHISHRKNRDSILKNGLELRGCKDGDGSKWSYTDTIRYEPRIFASNSKKTNAFDYVGFDDVDMWKIETDQVLYEDKFSKEKGHFFLKKPIPPENLKLIKCY